MEMNEKIRALLDNAEALMHEMRAIAETTWEREDWEAAKWLESSLYDLHGAWASLEVRELRRAHRASGGL